MSVCVCVCKYLPYVVTSAIHSKVPEVSQSQVEKLILLVLEMIKGGLQRR